MQIVKLTENEIEILVAIVARRCYKDYEFQFWNGEEVRLFPYGEIPEIVDESFFEILPRFTKNEDEIHIEETQMEEICEKIKKSLEGYYEVFDKDDFDDDDFDDYEYNNNPSNWND